MSSDNKSITNRVVPEIENGPENKLRRTALVSDAPGINPLQKVVYPVEETNKYRDFLGDAFHNTYLPKSPLQKQTDLRIFLKNCSTRKQELKNCNCFKLNRLSKYETFVLFQFPQAQNKAVFCQHLLVRNIRKINYRVYLKRFH